MADQLKPTERTVVTLPMYAGAVIRAWHHVGEGYPSKEAVAVLWAQYWIETGGAACWGWNLGNVKKFPNDGYDYHCLNRVWEGVSKGMAQQLIASGQAVADPSPDHQKAVGANQVSVIFNPPHPATRFRYFPNLDVAMEDHLVLLAKKRFSPAWPAVIAGDYLQFARSLKARGYFTASAEAYAGGMRAPFAAFMRSTGYEEAMSEITGEALPQPPRIALTLANFATVLDYQRELVAEGYDVGATGADGAMGPKTKAAIIEFQRRHGLVPDGLVGTKTKQAFLAEATKRGLTGEWNRLTAAGREDEEEA